MKPSIKRARIDSFLQSYKSDDYHTTQKRVADLATKKLGFEVTPGQINSSFWRIRKRGWIKAYNTWRDFMIPNNAQFIVNPSGRSSEPETVPETTIEPETKQTHFRAFHVFLPPESFYDNIKAEQAKMASLLLEVRSEQRKLNERLDNFCNYASPVINNTQDEIRKISSFIDWMQGE